MFTNSGWPPGLRRLAATGLATGALLALALAAGQARALPRSQRILVLHAGPGGSPIKVEYPGHAGIVIDSYALQGDGSLQREDGTPFQAAPSGAEGAGVLGPPLLARFDTLLITEADIATLFTEGDRRRLLAWVAEGHKLILDDSDNALGHPDYSFLPFPFTTDNPGALGASSDGIGFAEESALGTSDPNDRAHFLDLSRWVAQEGQELGDSNIVKTQAKEWCGHIFTANANGAAGFSHMYARHGRGLVIYSGLDVDDARFPEFQRLMELSFKQPVDPDGLTCKAPVRSRFVVFSPASSRTWPLTPGVKQAFPVKVYRNGEYEGEVRLAAALTPPIPGAKLNLDPAAVTLGAQGTSTVTLTVPPGTPAREHHLTVRGRDAAGNEGAADIRIGGRLGRITVQPSAFWASRGGEGHLEIVLDCSGSMAEGLDGKKAKAKGSTKMEAAREALRELVAKLPDGLDVALRVYGRRHRKGPEACTDTELLVPRGPLDRGRLLEAIDGLEPKGETPMVHAALEARKDFDDPRRAVVVLVTDGLESCNGNVAALRKSYQEAGQLRLNVVGFGVADPKAAGQIARLAAATGGKYYAADGAAALAGAIASAVAPEVWFTVKRTDAVELGRAELGKPVEVAPGAYLVSIVGDELPDELRHGFAVLVGDGEDVQLEIGAEGSWVARAPSVSGAGGAAPRKEP